MEESGPDTLQRQGAPGALVPQPLTEPALPKPLESTEPVQNGPKEPELLGENEPAIVEKPRPSIGLGR